MTISTALAKHDKVFASTAFLSAGGIFLFFALNNEFFNSDKIRACIGAAVAPAILLFAYSVHKLSYRALKNKEREIRVGLEQSLSELVKEIGRQELTLSDVKSKIAFNERYHNQKIAEFSKAENEAHQAMSDTQRKKLKLASLNESVRKAGEHMKILRSDLTVLESVYAAKAELVNNLRDCISSLESERAEARYRLDLLQKEKTVELQELRIAESKLTQAREEVQKFKAKIVEVHRDQYLPLKETIDGSRRVTDQERPALSAAKTESQKIRENCGALDDTGDKLERELRLMKEAVANAGPARKKFRMR